MSYTQQYQFTQFVLNFWDAWPMLNVPLSCRGQQVLYWHVWWKDQVLRLAYINSLVPGICGSDYENIIIELIMQSGSFSTRCEFFSQVNATESHLWEINTGWGNSLVPLGSYWHSFTNIRRSWNNSIFILCMLLYSYSRSTSLCWDDRMVFEQISHLSREFADAD